MCGFLSAEPGPCRLNAVVRAAVGLLATLLLAGGCDPLTAIGCNTTGPVSLVEIAIPPNSGKTGKFDGMAVDQAAHLLLVADRTSNSLDVLDIRTAHPRLLSAVALGAVPNGVDVATDLGRAFVGVDGGKVVMVDIDRSSHSFLTVTGRLASGSQAVDLVAYDPDDHLVLAAAPNDGVLALLDPDGGKPPNRITLGPGLEQPLYDAATRTAYVASSVDDVLWSVQLPFAAVQRFPLGTACGPAGMALNPEAGRVLVGCSDKLPQATVTYDLRQHRTARVDPKAGGADLAVYSRAAGRFFLAAGHNAAGPEIAIFSGAGVYQTAVGLPAAAPGVAFDDANRLIYTEDARPGKGGLFQFAIPSC